MDRNRIGFKIPDVTTRPFFRQRKSGDLSPRPIAAASLLLLGVPDQLDRFGRPDRIVPDSNTVVAAS